MARLPFRLAREQQADRHTGRDHGIVKGSIDPPSTSIESITPGQVIAARSNLVGGRRRRQEGQIHLAAWAESCAPASAVYHLGDIGVHAGRTMHSHDDRRWSRISRILGAVIEAMVIDFQKS